MNTATATATEALARARGSNATSNLATIFDGFIAKGIPEEDIKPRENVLTFEAWKAVGRYVRRGEHGVKVMTIATGRERTLTDGRIEPARKRRILTTVFHISQTEAY